jgi:hypothetical protein
MEMEDKVNEDVANVGDCEEEMRLWVGADGLE